MKLAGYRQKQTKIYVYVTDDFTTLNVKDFQEILMITAQLFIYKDIF